MYSIYTDYKTGSIYKFIKNGKVSDATYLGDINTRPDIYEKVNFNGKTYVTSVIDDSKKVAFVQELNVLEEGTEFEYEREAICPYCGSEQMDSWELSGDGGEENETYCGTCGEDFKYVRNIEITYSTYQK
ncbi:hypothetical protein ACDI16_02160 [Oceanobacillus caeni]